MAFLLTSTTPSVWTMPSKLNPCSSGSEMKGSRRWLRPPRWLRSFLSLRLPRSFCRCGCSGHHGCCDRSGCLCRCDRCGRCDPLNRPPKSPLHDGDGLVVPACFHRSGVLRGCRSFFRLRSSLLWLRQRLTWFCPRGRSFLRSPSVCGNATCALACPNRLAWIRLWLETSRLACLWTLPWKPWKRAGVSLVRPKCCRPSLVFSACPNA